MLTVCRVIDNIYEGNVHSLQSKYPKRGIDSYQKIAEFYFIIYCVTQIDPLVSQWQPNLYYRLPIQQYGFPILSNNHTTSRCCQSCYLLK